MQKITLTIKDDSKLQFFFNLMKQLDFVEVEGSSRRTKAKKHSIFSSAGLWKNRKIDAQELREKAWRRVH